MAHIWRTPEEFAAAALGNLGPGQRGLAFVLDPELRLRWPEDGDASIEDNSSGKWKLLWYRGNDMSLRARFEAGRPTVIWVRPAPMERADSIDLTSLADLVALADTFIDLSLAGMLKSLLSEVPLPLEIGAWAPQAGVDPPGFVEALKAVLEHRGKPVSRRHVLAAAICQASTQATPAVAWLDDSNLSTLVASYVHLVSLDRSDHLRSSAGEAFRHAASLLGSQPSGIRSSELAGQILQIPADTLIEQLYVLAAARRRSNADLRSTLGNHGLLTQHMESLLADAQTWSIISEAVDRINENGEALRCIAREAERRMETGRLRRMQGMLTKSAREWASEPAAAVRLALMASIVEVDAPGEGEDFAPDVELPVGAPRFVQAVEALQRLGRLLAQYDSITATAPEAATLDLDGVVDVYVGGLANAEYDFDRAQRDLNVLSNILGELKRVRDRVKALREACVDLLRDYDARLQVLLQNSSYSLLGSPRAIHHWLPNRVAPLLEPGRRVWILVFDGLRWDLWDRVLRPELERVDWTVAVHPGLAILPTETWICRRSLLGGRSPIAWAAGGSIPSEESLVRGFFNNLTGVDTGLEYRLRAEDCETMAARPQESAAVNVWVFQIPDKYTHLSGGSLQDVETQLVAFLRANVIPELSDNLKSEDLVFIAADHGFTRVSEDNRHIVSVPADRVAERFVNLRELEQLDIPGVEVQYPNVGRWRVAGGDLVYVPLGHNNPARSFRHGGASLFEMVVPLAELRVPARTAGELELDLKGPATIEEDSKASFVIRLSNGSSQHIKGQLLIESNLGREAKMPVSLAPGAQAERKCSVIGREGLEFVRVRLVSGEVTLRSRGLAIKVSLKPGIKLKGLEGLDDEF